MRPRASEADAIAAFERGPWNAIAGSSLCSVALVHVPFRLYRVDILNRGQTRRCHVALDAVTGTLDPYEFEQAEDATLHEASVRNVLPVRLEEQRARELIEGKMRRIVFQTGFFRVRGLEIHAALMREDAIYVPYWLGFFGRGQRASLKVMDAVRGRPEGSRARALFEDWLLAGTD